MGKDSGIQWTTHTFNPWSGCAKVSEGCKFCYAETLSKRNLAVFGTWGPNGSRVLRSKEMWKQPLIWDKLAREAGERHRVFCASTADYLEEWDGPIVDAKGMPVLWSSGQVIRDGNAKGFGEKTRPATLDDVRLELIDLIKATPNLDWLMLTKRSHRLKPFWGEVGVPDNVWLGVSIEDQATANVRIPHLLRVDAPIRFLSYEPALQQVDLRRGVYLQKGGREHHWHYEGTSLDGIDWVIMGGESGSKARDFELNWAEWTRDQCKSTGTAFFLKQLGAKPFDSSGSPMNLKDSHGGDWNEWPEDLRVREFPLPVRTS